MREITNQFIKELYQLPELSQEFVREETKEKVAELFERIVKPYFEGWKVNALRNLSDTGQAIEEVPVKLKNSALDKEDPENQSTVWDKHAKS